MTDRRIALILFLLVSTVYYASASAGGQPSHYLLLRSIADQGDFRTDAYKQYIGGDYALRDDHYYSDKPPGTAIAALPLYKLAAVLPGPIEAVPDSTKFDDDRRFAYLAMFPALTGAGAVVVLFFLLRLYSLSAFASASASAVYAFSTISFIYGGQLFSHSLSSFLVISGAALAIHIGRHDQAVWPRVLLLGFIAGLAVLVDYSSLLFSVGIAIYTIVPLISRSGLKQGWWQTVLAFGAGALPSAVFMFWYNTVCFGGPFVTSYLYTHGYPPGTDPSMTFFHLPMLNGLILLLFYGETPFGPVPNKGIFLLMPIMLTAIAGSVLYFKQHRKEAGLTLGIFLAALLLFSVHIAPNGGTGDSRYLSPVLPLLFIPVGFIFEYLHLKVEDPVRRDVLWLVVCGLIFVSTVIILQQFISADTFVTLVNDVSTLSTARKAYLLFSDIFGNWRNIPLLWILEFGLGLIGGGVIYGMNRRAA